MRHRLAAELRGIHEADLSPRNVGRISCKSILCKVTLLVTNAGMHVYRKASTEAGDEI